MKYVLQIFQLIKYPYVKHALILVTVLLLIIPDLIEPLIIQNLFDNVFPNKDINLLFLMVLAFGVARIFWFLLKIFEDYLSASFGPQIIFRIRQKLYSHIQKIDFITYSEIPNGELVSRLLNDVNYLEHFLLVVFPSTIENILIVCLISILLFKFNWLLALVLIPLSSLLNLAYKIKEKEIEKLSAINRKYISEFQKFFNENIELHYLIKVFGLEKNRLIKHTKITQNYIRNNIKFVTLSKLVESLGELIPLTSKIVLYGLGGYLLINNQLTLGSLIAFDYLLGLIVEPLSSVFKVNLKLQATIPAIKRILEYLELDTEKEGDLTVNKINSFKFEKVNFEYQKGQPILKNLTFDIKAGQNIAFVGNSGAGKTTITNLLFRLYNPKEGSIKINDIDISSLKIKSLRQALGVCSQDTLLFNTTIKENLKYGNLNATDREIIEACQLSHIHHFIETLPEKYETIVGERGIKLSGGQKQRLAIARAILKNPQILILDEATSHLDSESENIIQESLKTVAEGRTTIIIAHRLSTVVNCDRIFVLNQGKIVEEGKHQELLKSQGIYYKLWHEQFRFDPIQ
ncbi:MAG: ABC transporter ATP-binding protein [Moorea sp. SIO1G6]|uniref:ABC transporter ATP-binding protein n=1 Tax=Moorena producens (strain JHB) TaxID=1454205 RepID=A0A1D9FVQ5_MOOP1|nr:MULTISPECIES: ABC transporter ATP-binding protein [Moorena]AOY79230.1 ABC transporter ATP-binding protein [Moorena producens JHB]NES84920.1 ABC transporter ATP-binding protein [Moorena sp. SIO2B7]NET65598.1 ABC transporter ATP-binding protein [Moorena sp. SIO1G6]